MPLGPPGASAPDEQDFSDIGSRLNSQSSRVRFNARVHVSPTPPSSDASSSDFRRFYGIGQHNDPQVDGPQDGSRDEESRGRESCLPLKLHCHAWEADKSPCQNSEEEQLDAEGASSTVISKDRLRVHAWVRGGRTLKRALSESPSREDLIAENRRWRLSQGRGPYRPFEKPTDSMDPQNGSHTGLIESNADRVYPGNSAKRHQWW